MKNAARSLLQRGDLLREPIGEVLEFVSVAFAYLQRLLLYQFEGAEIAVSLVAFAVVATLVLQATTAGYVARRLGLLEEPDEA